MALYGTTKLVLNEHLEASFIENRAKSFGGAIYFADSPSSGQCSENAKPTECFLILNTSYSLLNSTSIALHFINNTVDELEGGTVLYGGRLDKCKLLFEDSIVQDECGNKFDSNLEYSRNLLDIICLLYTSPSPRDATLSRMPSSA